MFFLFVFCVSGLCSALIVSFFGDQYQCNRLPGKTRLWNDLCRAGHSTPFTHSSRELGIGPTAQERLIIPTYGPSSLQWHVSDIIIVILLLMSAGDVSVGFRHTERMPSDLPPSAAAVGRDGDLTSFGWYVVQDGDHRGATNAKHRSIFQRCHDPRSGVEQFAHRRDQLHRCNKRDRATSRRL